MLFVSGIKFRLELVLSRELLVSSSSEGIKFWEYGGCS
ncbi:hypothetical protein CIPAW_08G125900 [Carya illinoinensis]|uniref:Uncharacterized protein n=1 Tax=Carya illinoinensis TaxID=32201 RepID=A0A8T1PVT8_CARIL|nr:hypothetical protein CIPAW_08G125900 [Carya illinoinensis]